MLHLETNERIPTLAVLADDITGAFDTGVQFLKRGASVKATTSCLAENAKNADVLVVDAETRHLSPEAAYETLLRLARKVVRLGVPYLYLKTDSGLRGNVGMSLKAVLDGTGCGLAAFAPAYPDMARLTRDGRQLVDGVPVEQSVFARDPYDPVNAADIRGMIEPCGVAARMLRRGEPYDTRVSVPTVAVFDVETNADFEAIARHLQAQKQLRVTAGCAAFASVLAPFFGLPDQLRPAPSVAGPLLVVCGSLNPISREQMAYGERLGYKRIAPLLPQLLDEGFVDGEAGRAWLETQRALLGGGGTVLLDTALAVPGAELGLSPEELRARIARQLGRLTLRLLSFPEARGYTPMIIGGDTLMGLLAQIDRPDALLEGEAAAGVVLFSVNVGGRTLRMLSKSGGFGSRTILADVIAKHEAARE